MDITAILNVKDLVNNNYYLLEAIRKDDVDKVKECIKAGIDVNIADWNGDSALLLACYNVQIEIAKLLINAGANINYQDINKTTPLMFAIRHNKIDVVKLLVNAGADLYSIRDYNDMTAFDIAINLNNNITNYLKFHQRIKS